MEFYDINRLYDENYERFEISDSIDKILYFAYPTTISFGVGISLISLLVLTNKKLYITSKPFLVGQSIANFIYQLLTAIILISNYYEYIFINNESLSFNYKIIYLKIKIHLNFFYTGIYYTLIWLTTISSFHFCIMTIIQPEYDSNSSEKLENKLTRISIDSQQNFYYFEWLFCHKKTMRFFITFIYLFAFIFSLPQYFSYNVQVNQLTVEKMWFKLKTNDENFYLPFMKYDDKRLSANSHNQIGALTKINDNLNEKMFSLLRNNLNAKLASVNFDHCKIVKNEKQEEIINYFNLSVNDVSDKLKQNMRDRPMLNLSLACISNGRINEYLSYNTLYFWLIQTLVVWIPIFVAIVCLVALTYTIKKSRNFYLIKVKFDEAYRRPPRLILNIERLNLTKMHLIRLYLFLFLVVPYLILKLALSLFSRERARLNLDFYISYKLSYIFFHLFIIVQFFLLFFFNFKFRICFTKIFICCKTFKNLYCKCCLRCNCCYSKICGKCIRFENVNDTLETNLEGSYFFNMLKDVTFNENQHQFNKPSKFYDDEMI